jgi:hypothetical protein
VVVAGDALAVRLVSASKTASVPSNGVSVGTFKVEARWDDTWRPYQTITLAAGESWQITCWAKWGRRCKTEKSGG